MRSFFVPHARVRTEVGTVSMTKQSCKDECDINKILKQYQRTGIISHINNSKSQYLDLPSDVDYQFSMNTLIQAQDAFASLPSVVRDYFSNDPEKFLSAFGDPKMRNRLQEWGLLKPDRPADPLATGSQSGPEATSSSNQKGE